MQSMTDSIEYIQRQGTYRSLSPENGLLDFSSNDYLGLSNSSEVRNTLIEALKQNLPLGATGSRLLSGNLALHERVEDSLAHCFRAESALLFSSGYLANLSVMSVLGTEEAEFFSDELNHASLIDGIKLSKAKKSIFRHNDPADLREKLMHSESIRKVIVAETVFSMDGDLASVNELVGLAREFDAWIVFDEAHATGVFGRNGLGCLEEVNTTDVKVISIHTCGKALGAQGAFILSSQKIRGYLINFARPFIFSTAISPILVLQIKASVDLLPKLTAERSHLLGLAHSFRESIRDQFVVGNSESQIVPIILGSNERVIQASAQLQAHGFDVRPIRSPTVPLKTERLRISLKSFHCADDIQHLKNALLKVLAS